MQIRPKSEIVINMVFGERFQLNEKVALSSFIF